MADNLTLLDFDDVLPVEVRLGGRSFAIRPQSAAIVQKVLEYSSVDSDRPIGAEEADTGEGKDPRRFVRDVFSTWDDTVAATAWMLGVEAGGEEYAHLQAHLRPGVVMRVYQEWWRINEIDDFFERGGRALMPLDTVQRLQEIRARTRGMVADLAAQMVAEAAEEAPTPT